jgi:tRNA uridine 5-carboxymethylaminomethyl modification enzyme
MAGINGACRALGREPVVLRRDHGYIGVLIDDLVTKEMDEPYRMHTSQAEFRLLLRQDNAADRLSGIAHGLGLIGESRHGEVLSRRRQVEEIVSRLRDTWLTPSVDTNGRLAAQRCEPITNRMRAADLLCRSDVRMETMVAFGLVPAGVLEEVAREAETVVKYANYVERQKGEVHRLHRLENRGIPEDIDYWSIEGLRSESREKLTQIRPRTIGQASRIAGVAPSDVSVLLVHLERDRRRAAVR